MLLPFRCWTPLRSINQGVLSIGCHGIGSLRSYSKDKGKCCQEVAQAEGKRVEQWPKPDPPPSAWRCECPKDPQPTNYDPYRIKVPDVVVPPLPQSNAKQNSPDESNRGTGETMTSHAGFGVRDLFFDSPIVHPNYWKEKPNKKLISSEYDSLEPLPRLGYHGKNKYKYAFHEPWKPLDRLTLLAQAEKDENGVPEEDVSETAKKQITPQ